MILKTLKKIIFSKDKKNNTDNNFNDKKDNSVADSENQNVEENSNVVLASKAFEFASNKIDELRNEYLLIKEKTSNLLQTNYELGLRHIEKGNLSDAIFRFRFIKFFWPEFYDAYYLLAYCLYIDRKFVKSKEIIVLLLEKQPNYDKRAVDLLEKINFEIENKKS